jgi:hypothetical protein
MKDNDMKQFALSLALLSAVSISATKLEVELTHNGKISTEVLDLDVAKEVSIQNDEVSGRVHCIQEENNSLLVSATLIERKSDGTEVVVHDGPVIVFTLDSDGSIADVEENRAPAVAEPKSVLTVRAVK